MKKIQKWQIEGLDDFTTLSDTSKKVHTGTTAYTRLSTILIPANTITEDSVWLVSIRASRGTTGIASNASVYFSITGDATTEGSDFIRNVPVIGSNGVAHIERHIKFTSNKRGSFSNSGSFYSDLNSSQPIAEYNFDRTVDQYIYTGLTLLNASDIANLDYVIFKRIA